MKSKAVKVRALQVWAGRAQAWVARGPALLVRAVAQVPAVQAQADQVQAAPAPVVQRAVRVVATDPMDCRSDWGCNAPNQP